MYGQNLGGRPDAPGEPIFIKFCMRGRVPDAFLSFEFQKDRVKNVGAVWGRNFASPIDKAHRLYNSLLLPHKPWLSLTNVYQIKLHAACFIAANIREDAGRTDFYGDKMPLTVS